MARSITVTNIMADKHNARGMLRQLRAIGARANHPCGWVVAETSNEYTSRDAAHYLVTGSVRPFSSLTSDDTGC